MKIKSEFKGKTIVKNTALGNIMVTIDNIDMSQYDYYSSIGLGYIFEEEAISTTEPEKCIQYEGIDQEKPKRKRNAKAKS